MNMGLNELTINRTLQKVYLFAAKPHPAMRVIFTFEF